MAKLLKRYRVFLLLLAAALALGLLLPDIGRRTAELSLQNLREMLAVLPPIFILLGLLDIWVDRATMMRFMGKGSGIKGALISLLIGSAAAGPLYAAFPLAGIMLKKGSSLFNVFLFIGAWSTTKLPMLSFEAASMGLRYTLARLALSLPGIIAIALLTEKILGREGAAALYAMHRGDNDSARGEQAGNSRGPRA